MYAHNIVVGYNVIYLLFMQAELGVAQRQIQRREKVGDAPQVYYTL